MNTNAHTPGPWHVSKNKLDGMLAVMDVDDDGEYIVALVPGNSTDGGKTDHAPANAALIAIAPALKASHAELVGALRDALSLVSALSAGDWADCPEKDESIDETENQIRAALSRAKEIT